MKRKILFAAALIAAAAVAFSSCEKDTDHDDDRIYIEEGEGLADPVTASDEKVELPAAIVGRMPDYLQTALNVRFTNAGSEISDDLKVVVIAQDQVAANTEKLLGVYGAGGMVVVVNPDDVQLSDWCDENGVRYAGDGGLDNGKDHHLLYAFNKNANYYLLDDFVHDDDEGSCNIFLDTFVSWVNKYAAAAEESSASLRRGATRADDDIKYDIKKLFASQTVNHTEQMCLNDKTLAHVVASKADKLTRNGTIDFAYSVYPLYSFRANGSSAGDYYIVEGTFTVHNAQMYNGSWTQKHGGVKSHLCGFYLKKFEVKNTLCAIDGTDLTDVKFPSQGTPVPETTIGSTSYSSGFSWSISGSISGGKKGGAPEFSGTLSGNIGWNNTESRSVSDLTINEDSSDGKVGYVFDVNNTPHRSSVNKYTSVPSIASSDFTIHQSWIWYVPLTADNDTTTEFVMRVWVKPTYESYHWYSSAADFSTSSWDDAVLKDDQTFWVKLLRPNRIPKGVLELANTKTEQEYMTDIKIWKEDSNISKAPDYTIPGSFRGKAATIELPTGGYRVQVKLGASADLLEDYYTPGTVEIRLAETTSVDAGFDFAKGRVP